MLKLRLQYFGYLVQKAESLAKNQMVGKIESKRRNGQQRMKWLDSITDSMDMNSSKLWETVERRGACSLWGHRAGHDLPTEQQHSLRN